jgi:hypothetical protein
VVLSVSQGSIGYQRIVIPSPAGAVGGDNLSGTEVAEVAPCLGDSAFKTGARQVESAHNRVGLVEPHPPVLQNRTPPAK